MQLGKAASSVNKLRRTWTGCKGGIAQIKSRRTKALLTVAVVEYQAAFTPSPSARTSSKPNLACGACFKALPRHSSLVLP